MESSPLTMDGLTSLVSSVTGVPIVDIYTRTLRQRAVYARYMIMVLARRWFGYSYRQIAEHIGCRHTLVQYAMKRHAVLLENDAWYAKSWEILDDMCARLVRDRMVGEK